MAGIHDAHLVFDDHVVKTAGVPTTTDSTNVLNLGATRDIGGGEPLFLVVEVNTAFSAGTATVELQQGATASPTTAVVGGIFSLTAAQLAVAGAQYRFPVDNVTGQYVKLEWVRTTAATGAIISAWIDRGYTTASTGPNT